MLETWTWEESDKLLEINMEESLGTWKKLWKKQNDLENTWKELGKLLIGNLKDTFSRVFQVAYKTFPQKHRCFHVSLPFPKSSSHLFQVRSRLLLSSFSVSSGKNLQKTSKESFKKIKKSAGNLNTSHSKFENQKSSRTNVLKMVCLGVEKTTLWTNRH